MLAVRGVSVGGFVLDVKAQATIVLSMYLLTYPWSPMVKGRGEEERGGRVEMARGRANCT